MLSKVRAPIAPVSTFTVDAVKVSEEVGTRNWIQFQVPR